MILSSWHHPYYRDLLEAEGLVKAMDLLMWSLHISNRERVHPMIWAMADKAEPSTGSSAGRCESAISMRK